MCGGQSSAACASTQRVLSSELIAVALFLTLALCGLNAHLFVVLLKSREVLTGFRKFTLFHAFPDIPMHKSTLGVHEIKLVVDAREDFSNRGGVADHATSTHDLGQVTTWHHCWWLVVDATLEPGRRPIHELNRALCFYGGNRGINILGYDIAAVHHATRHVLSMPRVALHEHGSRLEDRHCDLCYRKLLMVGLLC